MVNKTEHIVEIPEQSVIQAAAKGYDEFCGLFSNAALVSVGGILTGESMLKLNSDQITLIAYMILRNEVMEGGFIQLIHNGYGPFLFENPFAKAMRLMGLHDFSKLLYDVRRQYVNSGSKLTKDCSDEEFMALYEQHPEYDEYDDEFIEREPEYTEAIARYIDEHMEKFAVIAKDECADM